MANAPMLRGEEGIIPYGHWILAEKNKATDFTEKKNGKAENALE